jgi:hypothetical protein
VARVYAFGLCAPLAVVVLHQLACGEGSHVFQGQLFVMDRGCLGTSSSVDVVEGDPPAHDCAATCLAQPEADGGRTLYVSTMCAPYPHLFDASGGDPLCPAALAALSRSDTCLLDGGSSNPAPIPDAAPE